jgi:hypothetical protein
MDQLADRANSDVRRQVILHGRLLDGCFAQTGEVRHVSVRAVKLTR